MCNMCYVHMYDILLDPLPINNILNEFINYKSLKRCMSELVQCFTKVLEGFDEGPDFFMRPQMPSTEDVLQLRIYIPDEPSEVTEFKNDEYIWNKFTTTFPNKVQELTYAINICLNESVMRKVENKEIFIKQFLMKKLRRLLSIIPISHVQHSGNYIIEKEKDLGRVPTWKLEQLKHIPRCTTSIYSGPTEFDFNDTPLYY